MSSERFSNDCVDRNFLCDFCNQRFPTSDHMGIHLLECASKAEQCPFCKRYFPRSIIAYHRSNNCTNPNLFDEEAVSTSRSRPDRRTTDMNTSSKEVRRKVRGKFEPLFDKTAHVQETLAGECYQSEVDHVVEKLQFNIIVMGSPRIGKSSLINALCGREVAKTSSSLDPCTLEPTCYTLEDDQQRDPNGKRFKINFYDTPGIESWTDNEGKTRMLELIKETDPVCVIYCASPGSTAKLDQLHSMLDYCKTKDIFCALVCTNMWAGNKRYDVIKEFEEQLHFFGKKIDKESDQPLYRKPHKITFFGKGALCTMVNSKEYYDPGISEHKMPVQGVDELIHGIMEALDQEKLLAWCYVVLYQRSYWDKIKQKVGGFFQLRYKSLYSLITPSTEETVRNFAAYFSKSGFSGQKK